MDQIDVANMATTPAISAIAKAPHLVSTKGAGPKYFFAMQTLTESKST